MPPRRPAPGASRPGSGRGGSAPRIDVGLQFEFRPSIGISARQMDKFGLDIRSFREPLKRSIQRVIAPSFKKNFDMEGRPERWDPLSEFAIEERGSAGPILDRTGLLKRTMQQFNIWTVDSQKAALLDLPQKIWYGKIHQAGYGAPKRKSVVRNPGRRRFGLSVTTGGSGRREIFAASIPARPFAVLQDPEDFEAIEQVFAQWIAERAARSGAFRPGLR